MSYKCPVCGAPDMRPYGTTGMTCSQGHQFLRADIERRQSVHAPARLAGRYAPPLPAWVPGAVLGCLALLVSLLDAAS